MFFIFAVLRHVRMRVVPFKKILTILKRDLSGSNKPADNKQSHGVEYRYIFYTLAVVFVVVVVVIVVHGYRLSTSYFLSNLQKYQHSKQALNEQWSSLAARAKTSTHYLMLLKRLYNNKLYKPYESVLVRALWKHSDVYSIVTLGVEYYLRQQRRHGKKSSDDMYISGKKTLQSFEKFLDKNVDVLWDRYPNMVRLYYIHRLLQEAHFSSMRDAFDSDELLRLYEKIKNNRMTIQDYNDLWHMTQKQSLLYLLIAKARQNGNVELASSLYTSLVKKLRASVSQNAMPKIQEYLAMLMNDIPELSRIVESAKTQDSFLNLTALHVKNGNFSEAWKTMQKYRYYPLRLSHEWEAVYFYLALRIPVNEPSAVDTAGLFTAIMNHYPHDADSAYEYISYLYRKKPNAVRALFDTRDTDKSYNDTHSLGAFPRKIFNDSRVVVLHELTKNTGAQPVLTALWNAYNDDARDPGVTDESEGMQLVSQTQNVLWARMLPQYFLYARSYGEFDVFRSNYLDTRAPDERNDAEEFLKPYDVYIAARSIPAGRPEKAPSIVTREVKTALDEARTKHGENRPWWWFYNAAVYYNAVGKYREANTLLRAAESRYTAEYHWPDKPLMPYVWAQYAYAAQHMGQEEEAVQFIEKIKTTQPSFIYMQLLERQ